MPYIQLPDEGLFYGEIINNKKKTQLFFINKAVPE
jgi:hypothetical protein